MKKKLQWVALGIVVMLLVATGLFVSRTSHTAHAAAPGFNLAPGESLTPGQSLHSSNGWYQLIMQTDGNLVEYDPFWKPLWWSGTGGQPVAKAVMQTDGNFVVYTQSGVPVWWSGTAGHSGASLSLQPDSNVVIYSSSGAPLWWTGVKAQEQYARSTWCSSLGCGTWEQDVEGYFIYDGVSAWAIGQVHCWSPSQRFPVLSMTISWCGIVNNGAQGGPLQFGSNWTVTALLVAPGFPPHSVCMTTDNFGRININPNGSHSTWYGVNARSC